MIYVTLQHLGFRPFDDFLLTTEGGVTWLSSQPQPTPAEIATAELPAAKACGIATNRAECERRIFARYPAGRQLSALAGLYDSANVATMTDWIAANISAENTAADAIEAATTVQAVEAVTVAWPA
ncbi:MAG: hypothetical protein IPI51_07210 [Betaproteobacteria bacterium]|nr:hypothetical protein [Betaproteobacteria bacterium]